MTRTEKQSELRLLFKAKGHLGIFEVIMRFGKTRLGCFISSDYQQTFGETAVVVVVAPSAAIERTWINELHKMFGNIPNNINVISVDKVTKLQRFACDLLIIDEIHRFTTDIRYDLLNGEAIEYKHFLGLTGTMPEGSDRRMLTLIAPVIASIKEEEAINAGWISDYKEYNVKIDFPEHDAEEYVIRSKPITDALTKYRGLYRKFQFNDGTFMFRDDLDLIYSCFFGKKTVHGYVKGNIIRDSLAGKMGWNDNLNLNVEYNRRLNRMWSPDTIRTETYNFKTSVDYRHELMVDNLVKLNAILSIMRNNNDKKVIVFNGNINFAEAVKDTVNNNIEGYRATSYHSKVGKRSLNDHLGKPIVYKSGANKGKVKFFGQKLILDDVVNGMIDNRYDMVSVVNAFDEGVDIPNLDMVIVSSGTSNVINQKQRTARGKTWFQNKVTTIVNIFFDDFTIVDEETKVLKTIKSRDKTKLKMRLQVEELPNVYSLNEFLTLWI